jgi:hypothetical protein
MRARRRAASPATPPGEGPTIIPSTDEGAVLRLDAAPLVLDDELGLLPASLLAGSSHGVGLPIHDPRGSLSPVLLDGSATVGTGLD